MLLSHFRVATSYIRISSEQTTADICLRRRSEEIKGTATSEAASVH